MGKLINIITDFHVSTKRDYLGRMMNDKVGCMKIAKKFGKEFWDGDRKYGYGGYKYDGRSEPIARKLIKHYNLPEDARILDVGCGKGYLLYEFKKLLPKCRVSGFDISAYAIANGKEELKGSLFVHKAEDSYPFKDKEFDLVISLMTLHNLEIQNLKKAFREIERVGKKKFIAVESYRNEQELFNLQCWALTAGSFHTPEEWEFIFKEFGYSGDYEILYFD